MRTVFRPLRKSVPAILLGLGLLAPPSPASGPAAETSSWSILLTLTSRGEYGWEGRDERTEGRVAFTAVWRGTLIQDGDDYLLLHGPGGLDHWEAEERTIGPDTIRLLTAGDFGEKPELQVRYILRTEAGLRMNFVVRGFEVPRAAAEDSFYLHFPVSAENDDNLGGLNYDLFVSEGSNDVLLDEARVKNGTESRTFRWKWRRRAWVQLGNQTILQTSAHEADASVVVTRKEKEPSPARR